MTYVTPDQEIRKYLNNPKPELGSNLRELLLLEAPKAEDILEAVHDELVKIEPIEFKNEYNTTEIIEAIKAQLIRISGIPTHMIFPDRVVDSQPLYGGLIIDEGYQKIVNELKDMVNKAGEETKRIGNS